MGGGPPDLLEARALLALHIRRQLLERGRMLLTTDKPAFTGTPDALESLLSRGPVDTATLTLTVQKEISFTLHACHRALHESLARDGPSPPASSLRPAALWAARAVDLVGETGWTDFDGTEPSAPLPSLWWAAAARSSIAASCLVLDAAAAEFYAASHPLAHSRLPSASPPASTGKQPPPPPPPPPPVAST